MNVIFIGLMSPIDLLIAVKTTEGGSYRYIKTEYGYTDIDIIDESSEFQEIEIKSLPDALTGIFEWKERFGHRIDKCWVHKP